MKKISITALLVLFIFGISGTSQKIKPWPADRIEHDLPHDPEAPLPPLLPPPNLKVLDFPLGPLLLPPELPPELPPPPDQLLALAAASAAFLSISP